MTISTPKPLRSLLDILSLSSLVIHASVAQQTNTHQQIFTLDAFSLQQTCVQSCFTYDLSGCTTDLVGSAIGCSINSCTLATGQFGALDSCYCRSDLQVAAESWLAACIKKSCTVGDTSANAASATSIYLDYCGSKGYATTPAENSDPNTTPASGGGDDPATSTSANPGTGSTAGPPSNPTGSTNTGDPPPNNSSSSSSSKTTYIALGVIAGLLGLTLCVAFVFIRKYRRSRRWPRLNPHPSPAPPALAPSMQIGPYLSRRQQQYPPPTSSAHPLRSDLSSNLSSSSVRGGRSGEIYPEESASSVGVVPPTYPRNMEPSLISTRMY